MRPTYSLEPGSRAADPWVCALSRQAAGPGRVASGSVHEAPDPGSPRGEGNKRARTSISTSTRTITSPGDTGCPPRPLITARHASRTAVVSSPELLQHVFTFLMGSQRAARRDLGRAALVCRLWREATVGEELWEPVAAELMPAMRRRVSEVGARRCVLECGHGYRVQRAFVGERWWWDLRLQVEVWDMLDDTCLLAADGRMNISDAPHELCIFGAGRFEVVGPAFSAASRDPVERRFASIDDYFRRAEDTVNGGWGVSVYVRDELRGRQALLWTSAEGVFETDEVPPDHPLRPHLPEGSRRVRQADSLPIYSPALRGRALRARTWFYVRPEAGQEGVAEEDKMWRLAGGDEERYGEHDSFFELGFDVDTTEAEIASLIRGLLEP
jgi:hypothetical protein